MAGNFKILRASCSEVNSTCLSPLSWPIRMCEKHLTLVWYILVVKPATVIGLQANQAGNSSAMEFMGFQQALAFLLGTTMLVKAFISDRHSQIAKWMRVECPQKCKDLGKPVIDHFFDLWHIGKSKLSHALK